MRFRIANLFANFIGFKIGSYWRTGRFICMWGVKYARNNKSDARSGNWIKDEDR